METAIKTRRDAFEQLGNLYPAAAQVNIEKVFIEGVACYWFTPSKIATDTVIVHLHGGAFVVGSIQSHKAMISHFSEAFKAKILFIDYSRAPEHPFPVAVNELLKVYNHIAASKIVLMGDSAGAGILTSFIAALTGKQPAGVIMLSPWLNLACDNPSYESNQQTDPILSKEYLYNSALLYAGDYMDKANPDNITFKEFPPVLVLVGSGEVLLDDSRNFIQEIKEVQDHAILSIYEGQNHVWPLSNISSEASQQAIAEMKEFIAEFQ
jgi:epsilon-lactone hydrolase